MTCAESPLTPTSLNNVLGRLKAKSGSGTPGRQVSSYSFTLLREESPGASIHRYYCAVPSNEPGMPLP